MFDKVKTGIAGLKTDVTMLLWVKKDLTDITNKLELQGLEIWIGQNMRLRG